MVGSELEEEEEEDTVMVIESSRVTGGANSTEVVTTEQGRDSPIFKNDSELGFLMRFLNG
jgi:hypothetical protein